jgi:hypothetical protein
MRSLLTITLLVAGCFATMAQTNEAPKKSPAELMHDMRLKQLTTLPSEFGQMPTQEFPQVCGVLMDWPIQAGTITLVARATGDASIYTTRTFGVIGGVGHERVRSAAKHCTKVAEKLYGDATRTREYPLPNPGRVRFYLLCYDGVRTIEADLQAVSAGKDKCSDLFQAGQRVITELRLVAQPQEGESR